MKAFLALMIHAETLYFALSVFEHKTAPINHKKAFVNDSAAETLARHFS